MRAFSFDPILDNLAYGIQAGNNSVLELLEVRRQLGRRFVEVAAASLSTDQLRVLRSTVDRMGARAALGEPFTDEDRFFHRTLYGGLGNQLLLTLLDVFWEAYVRAARVAARRAARRRGADLGRAPHLLELLEQRDGPGARRAMLDSFTLIQGRLGHAIEARSHSRRATIPGTRPETHDLRDSETPNVRHGFTAGPMEA